jgi:hypothetical protein
MMQFKSSGRLEVDLAVYLKRDILNWLETTALALDYQLMSEDYRKGFRQALTLIASQANIKILPEFIVQKDK